ncbi:hypothetical protein GCM10020358_11470 [Amorphoplanes nipponensis]|uniref:Uncharacterized protein n=1 Tax=Actinoplanes nipponensis TaxID=135950 RepID=A0A919MWL5_9ACTN|nr:hypothetical protein [Actinoplanes nipponensis]GIE52355.1 hypothetical protein Ani05nite_58890 [Actinoplanes nipponensis]
MAGYRRDGTAGLIDTRVIRGRGGRVDPRWDDAVLDIGEPLIDRTDNRYRAMALTPAGRSLLEQLRRPSIRRLLDRYAPPRSRTEKVNKEVQNYE